ncbi:hypothetical protein VTJ49DRAFT_3751 [Mycothermus thermophilus]|uniref:FAD-binding PCMH-type domain-containing protein n=1 Tax=Humicola insolens TaxID=85995 RepID=A0ABR3V6W3_HUMIN
MGSWETDRYSSPLLNFSRISKNTNADKLQATALGQCIGITGSGIGGGLGPLNGVYGLGLDQFVSFHVVLANGSFVTASQTQNPDLFWGLRGAGHNFGIITSAKLRIYDRPNSSTWSYQQLLFTGDKLEAMFETLNTKLDTQPGHLTHDVSIYQIGTDSAILDLRIFSATYTPTELDLYAAPFHSLGPFENTSIQTDYPGLIREMGYEPPAEGCTPPHGSFGGVFGVGVKRHNPAAMRNMYELFNNLTLSVPELGDSYVFIEGYGTEAVRKVDVRSTAFPGRGIRAWPNVVLAYKGQFKNDTLEGIVKEQGEKMRTAMLEGQERQTTYVNYAMEQESLEALYGYEEWRLKKLRKLKREVDPHNRFGFFAPIH